MLAQLRYKILFISELLYITSSYRIYVDMHKSVCDLQVSFKYAANYDTTTSHNIVNSQCIFGTGVKVRNECNYNRV